MISKQRKSNWVRTRQRKTGLEFMPLGLIRMCNQDVYIVTGGAIKLTHKMEDREHTKVELQKIERCRNYLLDLGVFDLDGLIEELEG